MAITALLTIEISGFLKLGPKGYLRTIFPKVPGLEGPGAIAMSLFMGPIELLGKLVKPFALTVRLFGNMTAGHFVILSLMGLIFLFGHLGIWSWGIGIMATLLVVAIMLLELFVALLQGNYRKEVHQPANLPGYSYKAYVVQRDAILDRIDGNLQSMREAIRHDQALKIQASSQISSQVFNITTIAAGLIVLIGITISLFNTQSINRSIRLLQEKTKEIAGGRFEEITLVDSPPEIDDLANHFNMMCRRLKELDEMKIDFISHVSHELRTPLTAIREASSMLLEGTYREDPDVQQELLTITKNECERLIDSVNRILDLSRMEANMMDYRYQKCRLIPVIQKAVSKLAPIAQRNHIRFELNLSEKLPPVRMDEERIGQVLENLIGNALKFSSSGTAVMIYASVKEGSQRFVEISIADSGAGIPVKNLHNIFDKFQRIEDGKVTTRGTGLGLSIAKHIIVAHGGKIWAKSEVGKGSTFFFTLPL